MKSILMASLAMLSLSAFAQDLSIIHLDASCTVECVTSIKQVAGMSGYRNVVSSEKAYFDVSGLSRQGLEQYLADNKLNICEKNFGKVLQAEKPDCLIFKH